MKESILRDKSYKFALRTIQLYKYLIETHKEFTLSRQIVKSDTSIGANIEEATNAQSKLDFIHKLSISQKEASEAHYWLRLLRDSQFINEKLAESLLNDCEELIKLLTASIKTAKRNSKN